MDKQRLEKYFKGECSPTESDTIEQYLETEQGKLLLESMADDIWREESSSLSDITSQEIFEKVAHQIEKGTPRFSIRKRQKIWGYAASLIAMVAVSFYFVAFNKTSLASDETNKVEWITKKTSKGQKSTVMLSDGSKVYLNAESAITYPRYFTDTSRNIELIGEAFFEVSKDKNRPFSVTANEVVTTALGTAFNVNGRDQRCEISLSSGKVLISATKNSSKLHFLDPGEKLEVDIKSGAVEKLTNQNNQDYLWKDGVLYFNNAAFNDIQKKLERWYNVSIEVENSSLINKTYNGRFDNSSLELVLQNLSFSLEFDYLMNGKNVKIIPHQQ